MKPIVKQNSENKRAVAISPRFTSFVLRFLLKTKKSCFSGLKLVYDVCPALFRCSEYLRRSHTTVRYRFESRAERIFPPHARFLLSHSNTRSYIFHCAATEQQVIAEG